VEWEITYELPDQFGIHKQKPIQRWLPNQNRLTDVMEVVRFLLLMQKATKVTLTEVSGKNG
jgi:hypothetical protein